MNETMQMLNQLSPARTTFYCICFLILIKILCNAVVETIQVLKKN